MLELFRVLRSSSNEEIRSPTPSIYAACSLMYRTEQHKTDSVSQKYLRFIDLLVFVSNLLYRLYSLTTKQSSVVIRSPLVGHIV